MLFSSLALLAIQLKAQGLNPSQVLFADALVTLSPFDYRHVPKLDVGQGFHWPDTGDWTQESNLGPTT